MTAENTKTTKKTPEPRRTSPRPASLRPCGSFSPLAPLPPCAFAFRLSLRPSALPLRLGVGLLLCLSLLALSAPPPDPQLLFTTNLPDPSPPDQTTALEAALLADLAASSATIDAALYEFDRPSIRDALLAAHARGVTVRLVTDGATRLEDAPTWDALTDAGIQVVDDGPGGQTEADEAALDPQSPARPPQSKRDEKMRERRRQ